MMLNRLLIEKSGRLQLAIVMLGAFVGMSLVMISMQLYFDFKSILTAKSDLISSQIITVNKRVNVLNTILNSKSTFSSEEIDEIRKLPDVKDVGAFKSNAFKLKASIDFGGQRIYSDLFFESVPEAFLDIRPDQWSWNKNQELIPIILPADYLSLYNFGFAPGQGLPQITQEMAGIAKLDIEISGNNEEEKFKGKIVGFSGRINSILVPDNFMDFANKKFGSQNIIEPSRLILLSDNASSPRLIKYFEDNGYDVNEELLKSSRLQSILRIILSIVLVLSVVIISLSLTGFVQYARLLINKKEYEITNLFYLGYTHKQIYTNYFKYFFGLNIIILSLAITVLFITKYFFTEWIVNKGFECDPGISISAIIGGIVLFVVVVTVGFTDIYFSTKKLAIGGRRG